MVVLGAARMAQRGEDAEAVAARAQELRESLKMWFAVDTLEFLKRSGRIGAASAWIGSTLKIKPILTLEQEITPIERVRTSGRAFERMVAYAEERHEAGADGWVVQHIQSRDAAERLADRCRQICSRAIRSSFPRSGPCSASTPARACSVWAAYRRRCWLKRPSARRESARTGWPRETFRAPGPSLPRS